MTRIEGWTHQSNTSRGASSSAWLQGVAPELQGHAAPEPTAPFVFTQGNASPPPQPASVVMRPIALHGKAPLAPTPPEANAFVGACAPTQGNESQPPKADTSAMAPQVPKSAPRQKSSLDPNLVARIEAKRAKAFAKKRARVEQQARAKGEPNT